METPYIYGRGIEQIVSPDAEITTNERGGSQSDIPVRFDLIDPKAMFEMAKVLDHGAKKYGEDNWRLISVKDHLNHLLMHTYAYLAGDETDEHLSHILCRATFAQGVALQEPNQTSYDFDRRNIDSVMEERQRAYRHSGMDNNG